MSVKYERLFLVILLCAGTIFYIDMKEWGKESNCGDSEFRNCNITYENFEKISIGDSYEHVVDILGEHVKENWTGRAYTTLNVKSDSTVAWGREYYQNSFKTSQNIILIAFSHNRVHQKSWYRVGERDKYEL